MGSILTPRPMRMKVAAPDAPDRKRVRRLRPRMLKPLIRERDNSTASPEQAAAKGDLPDGQAVVGNLDQDVGTGEAQGREKGAPGPDKSFL